MLRSNVNIYFTVVSPTAFSYFLWEAVFLPEVHGIESVLRKWSKKRRSSHHPSIHTCYWTQIGWGSEKPHRLEKVEKIPAAGDFETELHSLLHLNYRKMIHTSCSSVGFWNAAPIWKVFSTGSIVCEISALVLEAKCKMLKLFQRIPSTFKSVHALV